MNLEELRKTDRDEGTHNIMETESKAGTSRRCSSQKETPLPGKKIHWAAALLLTGTLLLSGCASGTGADAGSTASSVTSKIGSTQTVTTPNTANETVLTTMDGETYFSTRDLSGEVDTANAISLSLEGTGITVSAPADSDTDTDSAVTISGSKATITAGGTYILSGTLKDGSILVDVTKDEKVQLVLNGVSITAEKDAAIYVKQADKVFVTLPAGTENTLVNGGSFDEAEDEKVDGVIFAKDDITLNGSGILTIQSPAGHGIVGKDEVTITGGTYDITSAKTAIRANDSIAIADGTFRITADTDGLHAENNDDDTLGSIYIAGGTFTIDAKDDGVHATTALQIDGGTLDITAAEGLEATYITINDGDISIEASDDGINAAKKSSLYTTPAVVFNGGNTTIVMGAGDTDGVDANGDIIINGGTIDVTGNSTFDYDGTGTLNGGTVIVNGQQVTTLPQQMMGGRGGMGGGKGNGMTGTRPNDEGTTRPDDFRGQKGNRQDVATNQ